jgi:DNA-binding cell septation regulator SpoVG
MKRHGLSMRTKTKISQKMPQEYEEDNDDEKEEEEEEES